jgi:hypothetical protein
MSRLLVKSILLLPCFKTFDCAASWPRAPASPPPSLRAAGRLVLLRSPLKVHTASFFTKSLHQLIGGITPLTFMHARKLQCLHAEQWLFLAVIHSNSTAFLDLSVNIPTARAMLVRKDCHSAHSTPALAFAASVAWHRRSSPPSRGL